MSRSTPYHHGDLRNALVAASAELAESGGPEAVTVRAAARAVGVTATAAYRHFAGHEELLLAAKMRAQEELFASMRAALESVLPENDPVSRAVQLIHAAGRGYVDFALGERGLFRTAFCAVQLEPEGVPAPGFTMLNDALDELVRVGFTDENDRPGAEIAAWSVVHGLAMLIIEGPLGALPGTEREVVIQRTLATIVRGLATGPNAEPARSTDPRVTGRLA